MNKYISILRGINVSGQKKIKMAELTALYESLGFQNVVTYIQSGNVIFDSTVQNEEELRDMIERAINERFKFDVPIVIRTNQAIKSIIDHSPFGPIDLAKDGTKVLLTFLSAEPAKEKISEIQTYVAEPERLIIKGKEAYLHCPNGYGKTKLTNTFLEKKLEVDATTRNWKTVHKLFELSKS